MTGQARDEEEEEEGQNVLFGYQKVYNLFLIHLMTAYL